MAGVIYRNGIPYGAGSSDLIADYYSADNTYSAGDVAIYKGDLYKALVDINTPEAWNSAKWQKITVAQNISEIESGIDTLEDNIVAPFDEAEAVTNGLLRYVDTTVNGVKYEGIYKCNHLTAMSGPFDPTYWTKVVLANEITANTVALNGYRFSDPMTQAQYDALTTVDPNTLYIIVPT